MAPPLYDERCFGAYLRVEAIMSSEVYVYEKMRLLLSKRAIEK